MTKSISKTNLPPSSTAMHSIITDADRRCMLLTQVSKTNTFAQNLNWLCKQTSLRQYTAEELSNHNKNAPVDFLILSAPPLSFVIGSMG